MQVRVIYFEGCPNHEPVMAMVREVASETGTPIELCEVKVASDADARRERMLGSPTVQVDGVDIDPGAQGRDDFAMSCRVFDGPAGLPPREMIAAALEGRGFTPPGTCCGGGSAGCCS